jgi:hypothetical protein
VWCRGRKGEGEKGRRGREGGATVVHGVGAENVLESLFRADGGCTPPLFPHHGRGKLQLRLRLLLDSDG